MPSPTTAIVAMPTRSSTPSISPRAISALNSRSRLSRASSAPASGTLKQIECSDEACVISETEIWRACSAANVRAAMPGTPSIPFPVTVTSACPIAAVSAFTGNRAGATRSDTSVPGEAGSPKGRTKIGIRRPVERNERARVQHLGAVVGQLGGLSRVQLGNHPRLGHDAGVGGEEPGHVLPQRHPRCADRAGHQRGREIGAAPAEGGDLAVRGGADEAGHDGDDTARQQRQQHPLHCTVGAGVVGRGAAERAVGVDHLERLHVLRSGARRIERARHELCAQPLAAGDEIVGGAGRQLSEQAEATRERLQLVERLRDV